MQAQVNGWASHRFTLHTTIQPRDKSGALHSPQRHRLQRQKRRKPASACERPLCAIVLLQASLVPMVFVPLISSGQSTTALPALASRRRVTASICIRQVGSRRFRVARMASRVATTFGCADQHILKDADRNQTRHPWRFHFHLVSLSRVPWSLFTARSRPAAPSSGSARPLCPREFPQ